MLPNKFAYRIVRRTPEGILHKYLHMGASYGQPYNNFII